MPSITLTFSNEIATRLQTALESRRIDGEEPITLTDLKNHIVQELKSLVISTEAREAQRVARETAADVDIT